MRVLNLLLFVFYSTILVQKVFCSSLLSMVMDPATFELTYTNPLSSIEVCCYDYIARVADPLQ